MDLYRSDLYKQKTAVIDENNNFETKMLLARLNQPDLKEYYQKLK